MLATFIAYGGALERDWTQATIGERLEHVREHIAQAPNLREFWRRLLDHDQPPLPDSAAFSYDAVRTWHADREPPVGYVTRVSDVFEVTLHWLMTGRGHMTYEAAANAEFVAVEREVARRLEEERADSPRPYSIGGIPGREVIPMNDLTRNGLIELWRRIVELRDEELGEVLDNGLTRGGQLWLDLQHAVVMPLDKLDLPRPADRDRTFNEYALAVALALVSYVGALADRAESDGQA